MINKIRYTLSKGFKYIFKEVIIKFLLCYLISVLLLVIASKINDGLVKTIIINIASSLISIPIVFIVYDLYKKLLIIKSTKLINETVDEDISHIFLRFLYFTTLFYNEIDSNQQDLSELNDILRKDKERIFSDLSSNKHHGYFIFSIFDDFAIDIDNVLESNKIIKFIGSQEISALQEFINDFNKLKMCFSVISDNDFIKYQKLPNTHMRISNYTNSSDKSITFYDIFKRNEDSKTTYYCAKYRIYEEEPLMNTYKLSGNKAKELSIVLHDLYKDIQKWMRIRGMKELAYDHGIVSCGRLYLDNNITMNSHMSQNVSIHGIF